MPQKVLISEVIRNLIIKDCTKRFGYVQDCGIFILVFGSNKYFPHKTYIIANCFVNTENNEQKWLLIENSEILNKISILYENMAENWDEMLIVCNIKTNKFSTEFFNDYNPRMWNDIIDFSNMLKYYSFKLKML